MITLLPVPPTREPENNIISPFWQRPTPTLLSFHFYFCLLPLSPFLFLSPGCLLTWDYLLNTAVAPPTSHAYYQREGEEKQMNHGRQRERRPRRYGAGAIDGASSDPSLAPRGGGTGRITCMCVRVDPCARDMCQKENAGEEKVHFCVF